MAQILLVDQGLHGCYTCPVYDIFIVTPMRVEASIELGWQLLLFEELFLNVRFHVALHFSDVMDTVSDLLTDKLPNLLVDGQTHTGSLQLHSYV